MEDSNNMTVEFLRARLLAERSVSRSAKQRSEELAKRVAELEEQLMFVSLQRKKAEKATADVLSILENNGISDFSEGYYSSSDQETPFVGNGSAKEENGSINSKVRKSESEELSGSDFDLSSVNGRSLSWKGRKGNSHSLEKYKDAIVKRRSSFGSIGYSSPKHRQGKSCRQIKRKESRSAVEECKTDSVKVKTQQNGTATSESFHNRSYGDHEMQNGGHEIQKEKSSQENTNLSHRELKYNGYEGEQAMEKALEHQAELIGRYEAMEKTQREWEEKFRENTNTTLDSCDPGNHSDVTEEREETKVRALHLTETHATPADVSNLELEHTELSQHQKSESKADFALTMAKEAPKQNIIEKNNMQKEDNFSKGQTSGTHNEHETSYGLGGILESLKQAKLSLQREINKVPQIEGRPVRKINGPHCEPSSVPVMNTQARADIPVGCAGLFILPTDFTPETRKSNLFEQNSQLALPDYRPDTDRFIPSPYRDPISTNDRFFSSPLTETRSSIFTNDRNVMSPYLDARSGVPSQTPPYLNILSPPSRYVGPTFSDPSRSAPHNNGATARSPSPDHFSFYDNHIRPNMYRH